MLGLHSLMRTSVLRVSRGETRVEFNSGDSPRRIIKSWTIKFMVSSESYSSLTASMERVLISNCSMVASS